MNPGWSSPIYRPEKPILRIFFSSLFRHSAFSALIGAGLALACTARAEVTPAIGADMFRASDGAELPMRIWMPREKPRALIVAMHGFADYSISYARPAAIWAKKGIATFAYDQRGFGGAPHVLHWSSSERMMADATEAVAALRARYPG